MLYTCLYCDLIFTLIITNVGLSHHSPILFHENLSLVKVRLWCQTSRWIGGKRKVLESSNKAALIPQWLINIQSDRICKLKMSPKISNKKKLHTPNSLIKNKYIGSSLMLSIFVCKSLSIYLANLCRWSSKLPAIFFFPV